MRYRRIQLVIAAAGIIVLAGGCSLDNGLPGDLTNHLAEHGISVRVSGSKAPWSSRAGVVLVDRDPAIEARIIAEFDLKRVEPESAEFRFISARVSAKPEAVWGASRRPAKLRLKNGGQFEYLYLITASDGRTYLVAEYAYG